MFRVQSDALSIEFCCFFVVTCLEKIISLLEILLNCLDLSWRLVAVVCGSTSFDRFHLEHITIKFQSFLLEVFNQLWGHQSTAVDLSQFFILTIDPSLDASLVNTDDY
jgi:hypothetical protein